MRVTAALAALALVCLLGPFAPALAAVDQGQAGMDQGHAAMDHGTMAPEAGHEMPADGSDMGEMGDMDMGSMTMDGVPDSATATPMGEADAPMEHDHEAMMAEAEKEGPPVGVDEHLGAYLPEDAWFTDSEGQRVNLRELVGNTPTLLLPVYFSCPNVCHILQSSFARVLPQVNLEPGSEIQVVSLSFDKSDDAATAARNKKNFAMALQDRFPAKHWHFLTGDAANINRAMGAVGFHFKQMGKDFAHPVVVIALAPGGKVVRYLYGTDFLPFDVTMAATEAAQGKTGMSVKRVLSFCFSYDPEGRRYTFDMMRVAGISILTFLAIMLAILFTVGKKKKTGKRS